MELPRGLRLLVLDAYPEEGRAALARAGGTLAGALYERRLRTLVRDAAIDIAHPADAESGLDRAAGLGGYDGIVWTGSSLTIHDEGDVRVRRQIELARTAYAEGVPSFGSCWGAQIAVVAAGGTCAANPRGREFGVSRKITPTEEGRAHPLFQGRGPVFDALTSHADEITKLPPNAQWLAANPFTRIQAVAVRSGRGSFWAVQYHPEYDLHEVARLAVLRGDELIAQGAFADAAGVDAWIASLEALHREPARGDLAFALGVDADVLDAETRLAEVRAWLEHAVRPALAH